MRRHAINGLSTIVIVLGGAVSWRIFSDPTIDIEVASTSCLGIMFCAAWLLAHH